MKNKRKNKRKRCLICSKYIYSYRLKNFKRRKFCSRKCFGLSHRTFIIKNCKICNKQFKDYRTNDQLTCSVSCGGRLRRIKRYKVYCKYCNKKLVATKKEIENGNKRFCSKVCIGKFIAKTYGGFYSIHKFMREKNPRQWFLLRSKIGKKGGKKGGLAAILSHRKNKPYHYYGVCFDSKPEVVIAKYLKKEFRIHPRFNYNCQVRIGGKEFDFCVPSIDKPILFVEYHPYIKVFSSNRVAGKKYYKIRRHILDENNFGMSKLLVFENLKSLNEIKVLLEKVGGDVDEF